MSEGVESSETGDASRGVTDESDGVVEVAVGDGAKLSVPAEASDGEAAAIVVAVGAHLTDLDRAAAAAATEAGEADTGWDGRRWAFAGRTEAVSGRPSRPTDGTPTDAWAAAGRSDRL